MFDFAGLARIYIMSIPNVYIMKIRELITLYFYHFITQLVVCTSST